MIKNSNMRMAAFRRGFLCGSTNWQGWRCLLDSIINIHPLLLRYGAVSRQWMFPMDKKKIERLNILFEKSVAEKANILERRELEYLYKSFFNEGREELEPRALVTPTDRTLVG